MVGSIFYFWGSGEFGVNAAGLAGLGRGGVFFYSIFFFLLKIYNNEPAFVSATVDLEYDTV